MGRKKESDQQMIDKIYKGTIKTLEGIVERQQGTIKTLEGTVKRQNDMIQELNEMVYSCTHQSQKKFNRISLDTTEFMTFLDSSVSEQDSGSGDPTITDW